MGIARYAHIGDWTYAVRIRPLRIGLRIVILGETDPLSPPRQGLRAIDAHPFMAWDRQTLLRKLAARQLARTLRRRLDVVNENTRCQHSRLLIYDLPELQWRASQRLDYSPYH